MPKFLPSKPLELVDPKGRFGKDNEFIDRLIQENIEIGGIWCQILLWEGTFSQPNSTQDSLAAPTPDANSLEQFLGIQDTVLLEARDVQYADEFIPLKAVYTVSQNEVDYARFGYALANDVLTMEFHIQSMERQCGRRLIPGDVIELPHLREVDINGRVANKWYQVSSVVKSPGGFDAMYGFHVLSVILKPARNQQELYDIMNRKDEYGKTLADQASTHLPMLAITENNQNIADNAAHTTWWDTTTMYLDPKNQSVMPFRDTDDGKPPNGIPVNAGPEFPTGVADYTYFVRSDSLPNVLYQFYNGRWNRKEVDQKREWQPYNWTVKLREFISDRGDYDEARPWELRTLQDVLTPRESISNPSPGPTGGVEDELSVPRGADGTYPTGNDPLDQAQNDAYPSLRQDL